MVCLRYRRNQYNGTGTYLIVLSYENIHRRDDNSFILCTKSAKNELKCEEIEDIINTENKFERKYYTKGEYK